MKIYWLEQPEADLPQEWPATRGRNSLPGEQPGPEGQTATPPGWEWLSPRELRQLHTLRFAQRRADWLLGRWTAKQAVAACLSLPPDFQCLEKIEVRPAPSGAPEIFISNNWAPVTISLSHRSGRAVSAVAPSRGALGCDLEIVEPRSDAFIDDYFAREEQGLVARAAPQDRPWLVTLLWSAKESALKTLRAGLRLDTRCVIVTPIDALGSQDEEGGEGAPEEYAPTPGFTVRPSEPLESWHPMRVRHVNHQTLLGWWQHNGSILRTLVASPPPALPVLLNVSGSATRGLSVTSADRAQAA
jgi:4'-phosphopantetheinyl transferase